MRRDNRRCKETAYDGKATDRFHFRRMSRIRSSVKQRGVMPIRRLAEFEDAPCQRSGAHRATRRTRHGADHRRLAHHPRPPPRTPAHHRALLNNHRHRSSRHPSHRARPATGPNDTGRPSPQGCHCQQHRTPTATGPSHRNNDTDPATRILMNDLTRRTSSSSGRGALA